MSFVKRVGSLFSGTALAQAVQLFAIPALSRLYGPRNYGAYGTFAACLLFAGMAATLRYELAIVLPRVDRVANELARACAWISAAVGGLVLVAGLVLAATLRRVWLPGGFAEYLAVSSFLVGLFNTMSALAIRHHRYRAISVARFVQVVASVATSVACASAGLLEQGLLIANVAGYATACTVIAATGGLGRAMFARTPLARSLAALRRYKTFPMYNMPQALMDGLRPLGTVFSVQYFFGAAATGVYHLANQTLQTPTLALSQAISQVYFRDLVDSVGTARARRTARRLVSALAAASLLGLALLWRFGNPVTMTLFGARWAGVHGIMMSIGLVVAVNFVVSPLVFVFHVQKRHREFLLWGVGYNVASILAIVTAARSGAPMQRAVLAYSVCASAVLVALGARSLALAMRRTAETGTPEGEAEQPVRSQAPRFGGGRSRR